MCKAAMWANINNKHGVTLTKSKKPHKNKRTGGNFEKRRPIFTEKGIVNKAPNHSAAARIAALKKKYNNTLIVPMEVQNQLFAPKRELPLSVLKTAVKFAEPIAPIIGEMIGLKEPALITKEVLNSFEGSIEVYEETKDIDEAVLTGIKSFVINYAKDKMGSYIKNVVEISNKVSDKDFDAALRGSILMTSLYSIMENV